jgi:hypothetical protein
LHSKAESALDHSSLGFVRLLLVRIPHRLRNRPGERNPVSDMSKRSLAWIVIVLVGALSSIGMLWSGFGSIHVVFSAAELQTRLNQGLPRTVLNVTITHVALNTADDRLGLRIDIQTNVLHEPISAVMSATGVPRYDGHREAMYFDVDEIKSIKLPLPARRSLTKTLPFAAG